jgi:hypothetical protein
MMVEKTEVIKLRKRYKIALEESLKVRDNLMKELAKL